MHSSPPHQAGSERDEPALAAGRTWSPRRETARLAAFRPLAFPAGPLARYPAAGAASPCPWPVARPDRPSVRRGSADGTCDGCRGGTAASSRPAPVGQARTARHQPPACEGITRRTAGRAWLPDLPGTGEVRQIAPSGRQPHGKSGHPGPGPPRPPAPRPPARRLPPPAMTAGPSGDDKDADLDRLTRQYPQWRMWRGRATGDYWAMPPRGHPTARELISASDIGELARRLAQAEGRHGL
jgi:hypothetical protein